MTNEHFRVALLRPQPSFNPILLPPGPTDGNHAMPSSITPALNTFSHHNNCSTMVETNCSTIFLLQSCRKNPAKNAPFSLFFPPHPVHCSVSALAARQTWTRQHLQVECQISFLFSFGLIGFMPLQLSEFIDLSLQFIILESYNYNFTALRNIPLLALSVCFIKLWTKIPLAFFFLSSPLSFLSLREQTHREH